MKKLFIILLIGLSAVRAQGQFNYAFSYYTQTYVPLTSGTVVNTAPWDEEWYKMPIGFNFNMDGRLIDSLSIMSGNLVATDTADTINAFIAVSADLMDRNYDTGTISVSPIRYSLTGTTPNRIFKMEVYNAGFWDELDVYSTVNDSVSYQVWLYEASNIVELRYGPSSITHYSDYFYNDSSVANVGFIKDIDWDGTYSKMFYYLDGNHANPTVDSTNDLMNPLNDGLDSIPPSGTVYRFTPVPASVHDISNALKLVKIYPSICQQDLYIEQNEKTELSYRIVSMNGAQLSRGTAQTGKNKIDIGDLPAGVYTIQMMSKAGGRTSTFIKL